MAGSRKGEKRGAAGSPASKARGGGKSPHKIAKKTGRLRVHAHQVKKEEYYRDIQRVLYGGTPDDIEPREVMLEAMRFFHGQANEAKNHKEWIMTMLADCKTPEDFIRIELELASCDIRIRDAYLLAGDCGFKVAPYIHAKLSSVEVTGPDKGPIEIMHILLKEITDENRGRPSWQQESGKIIEHEK